MSNLHASVLLGKRYHIRHDELVDGYTKLRTACGRSYDATDYQLLIPLDHDTMCKTCVKAVRFGKVG